MLIDWFTVGAQALNFIILAWLLKRYLYKPILRAIDAREKRIADELADAKAKRLEAQSESDEFRSKNAVFDRQRAELMSKATEGAKIKRQWLIDSAWKESEALRAKLREALRNEQHTLGREIASRTQQEIFSIARKTLADLANTSLEERISDVFILRLKKLSGVEREALISTTGPSSRQGLLRSAFDLPPPQRSAIDAAVKDTLGITIELRFETAPDLVGGVELTVNGHKLAWSIKDYLTSLADHVGESLEKETEPKPAPDIAPDTERKTAENVAGQLAKHI
jgi:F-type H+-transporting ATPase subunit b